MRTRLPFAVRFLRLDGLSFSEKCLKQRWLCNRRLTREITADVDGRLPLDQATILQERDRRALRVRRCQGNHLEGLVAVANDAYLVQLPLGTVPYCRLTPPFDT